MADTRINLVLKRDMQRNISSGVTGVATGFFGNGFAVFGAVAGLLLQTVAKKYAPTNEYERIIDGVVDGSAALVGYTLARGAMATQAPARARAIADDSDALVG